MPDGDEATEILLESLYEGIAASFIESHRKNVQRGMDYNAERCLYNGIKLIGYHGETDKPYEVDPEAAPIVTRIFNEYADVLMPCSESSRRSTSRASRRPRAGNSPSTASAAS